MSSDYMRGLAHYGPRLQGAAVAYALNREGPASIHGSRIVSRIALLGQREQRI
jgi:hypothetical protein